MRALGFAFEIDKVSRTVHTLMDGQPADPIIEAETQRRAWWLLEHGVLSGADDDELRMFAPDKLDAGD